ncbi:DUF6889 family protein [Cupriavidus basilensis]
MEGACQYESLIDGTIGLADVALLNDAIAVRNDNRAELRRRMEANNG